MISLRPAQPEDSTAIHHVLTSAFPTAEEASLVEALRADGSVVLELVAEAGDVIVGHILYSELPLETAQGVVRGAALAPLAVMPAYQRRGVGGALIRMSLPMLTHSGVEVLVVLGDPAYYTRFGFGLETAAMFETSLPAAHLMAMELEPGVIEGRRARPRYAAPFGL